MNIKNLLILSAAALTFSAVSANAADTFSDEAPPPELSNSADKGGSVAICEVAGKGYFFIPGTETCIKIGGTIDARFGFGNTKYTLGGVTVERQRGIRSRVDASFDIDTHAESEIGAIKTKLRVGAIHRENDLFWNDDNKNFGVELAYISAGPAYIGYKETLFNTKLAYGDYMDINDRVSLNTLTAGLMFEDLGFGLYAGIAAEDWHRNQFISSYDNRNGTPDIVGRIGLAGQSWGATDLSVLYSDHFNTWLVKSTSEFNIYDKTQARFTASYAGVDGDNEWGVTGGLQYAFTDKVAAYGGGGYIWSKHDNDMYLANAGVVYTLVPGFDISGEFGYSRLKEKNIDGKVDDVSTMLRFKRTW